MTIGSSARVVEGRRDSVAARLGALAGIARAAWAGTRAELLQQVAEAAYDAVAASAVSIAQWEPTAGRMRVLVNYGSLAPAEVSQPEAEFYSAAEYSHLDQLINELRGWMVNLDTSEPGVEAQLLLDTGMHCSVGVPIPLEGRVWGELYLARTADQPCLTDIDVDLALVVAAQVGAALATADHLAQIDRLAHTDPLTGLANRRAVDEALDSTFREHLAHGTPVSLIVCDLNGLKRINDDQGHDAGDRALVRFAGMLISVADKVPGALAARLGGDEFCIVVGGTSSDAVVAAAEELCRLVLRSPLEGVSCGVASTADDVGAVESPGRLFRLADAAQYRAKRSRATAPVVAGRSLPPEVAAQLSSMGPVTGSDRRMFRGREISDSARILRSGLELLDETRSDGVLNRLVAVAEFVAERCDAFSWAISSVDVAAATIHTEQVGLYRQREDGVASGADDVPDLFALDDFPLTRTLIRGGVSLVDRGDAESHPEESELLAALGAQAGMIAGCTDPEGVGWLIEIYGDSITGPFDNIAPSLRGLMAVAVAETEDNT